MGKLHQPASGATLMSPAALQEGIASLSRGVYFREASLSMMLSILTESAAQMSGVERVSIWALTNSQSELTCLDLYEQASGQHSKGASIDAGGYPVYFRALQAGTAITADDAYLHPLTAEFASDYLPRHKVTAMLDTPIHIRGELQGVLCLEQVASRQPWTAAHQLFAQAVANLVTLALVEYEAEEARRAAKEASERLRAVFDASRDALFLADRDSGEILDVNRQAEALVGRTRNELLGRHQGSLHPAEFQKSMLGEFRQMFDGCQSLTLASQVQHSDGRKLPVEITAEVADLSDGRRLALSVFRPV
uniref:PAS protein n=1 Tax=Dechloromonas aromatica (strain RCB) TaxID=159087 RepID=Q47JC4_DECAR